MVEESETPGQGGRVGESDFLAERRARRATETGEAALQRRAEAAEATVRTLESHVSSLQQRLQEAEQERRRVSELLEGERAQGTERESELRRVKQREYAEQQLRVEAEDRLSGLQREGQERASQLSQRVSAGERDTTELSRRIEDLERQLSEAEQAAAAERASLRKAETELQGRVGELERRAEEVERGLHAERAARESSERELAAIREGHRRMEGVLGEIRGLIARLAALLGNRPRPAEQPPVAPQPPPARPVDPVVAAERGAEMADALAAAVERLRARALSAPPLPEDGAAPEPLTEPAHGLSASVAAPGPAAEQGRGPLAPAPLAVQPAVATDQAEPVSAPPAPAETASIPAASVSRGVGKASASAPETAGAEVHPKPSAKPVNKHSQSLIGRLRNRRKQRKTR